MGKRILLVCLAALFVFSGTAFADFDELIGKVDHAWLTRSGNKAPMIEALGLAEKAYSEKPGFAAAWRAARACFWICDRSEDEKVDLRYGKIGYEWGLKAIEAKPDRVEGHYYYTICLGEYGKGLSIPVALIKGLGGKYEKGGKKAIQIKPGYEHAGAFRAMGRYYFKLPWPKYSFKQAEAFYLDGLKIAPGSTRARFYLAELYVKEKMYKKARQSLQTLAGLKGYPDEKWESAFYKEQGKALFEKIKDKQ